jgi:ubiquinone/menaquinone biosynthesis C-methylase UbiE
MSHRRMDVARAHRLDAPERMLYLPVADVLDALALAPGEIVADIGAGTGYFSIPIARAVIPGGRVYALDVQPEMLTLLNKKLGEHLLSNMELVHADAGATTLPDASCNLVFMANVWHEFEDRAAALREARRILKPGGRIAILDWRPDVEPEHGPPLEHRLPASDARAPLNEAGFRLMVERNIGRYSWFVLAALPATSS